MNGKVRLSRAALPRRTHRYIEERQTAQTASACTFRLLSCLRKDTPSFSCMNVQSCTLSYHSRTSNYHSSTERMILAQFKDSKIQNYETIRIDCSCFVLEPAAVQIQLNVKCASTNVGDVHRRFPPKWLWPKYLNCGCERRWPS